MRPRLQPDVWACTGQGQVTRFRIADESLLSIRAALPTASDSWEVDTVAEYRCVGGTEQWLVKWKDYGEDRNTWEPWENLLSEEAQAEARTIRDATLPSIASKLTVPVLRRLLEEHGWESSGLKADLVARLLQGLAGSFC